MTNRPKAAGELLLGIEGGGTRTVALLADAHRRVVRRTEAGPANLKLMSDAQLVRHFRALAAGLPRPAALGIGLAGAWAASDRRRIRRVAARVWPNVPCCATQDLDTALAAAPPAAHPGGTSLPRVLVISGTGSCCYGQNGRGQAMKVGGWGHLLGDEGSSYEIGLCALKSVAAQLDATGQWPRLGRRLLRRLLLNEANELIDWVQGAAKAEIASLAVEVFAAAKQRDPLARRLLAAAADRLAQDAVTCARRLFKPGTRVEFVLAGSTLLKQPRFAAALGRDIRRRWPRAVTSPLRRESIWGAVELAAQVLARTRRAGPGQALAAPAGAPAGEPEDNPPREFVLSTRMSPTEQRNPRSMRLDQLSVSAAVGLMLAEDARLPRALGAERRNIERTVEAIGRAFKHGGRVFYLGAGTSGRLGVLDASECPVTFRSDPETVQGIIAGGQSALWRSVEGAEDDADAGAEALRARGVGKRDVVVGIAASGRTPFVWGGLIAARQRGATTVLICFNPHLKIRRAIRPDIVVAPNIGPEIVTGSTRLKAGTATKMLLNVFSTLGMVRAGKVISNLMVDVKPANVKLRDRAVRIVQALTGADYAAAKAALEKSHWIIRAARGRLLRSELSRAGAGRAAVRS